MSKLGWLGLAGLLGFFGIILDNPRWFRLYGLFGFYPLFALKRDNRVREDIKE